MLFVQNGVTPYRSFHRAVLQEITVLGKLPYSRSRFRYPVGRAIVELHLSDEPAA